jgi:hypothetical protein
MFDDEAIAQILDMLILEGGVEMAGISPDTGEFLYRFTPKIKDIMPELYDEHLNMVNAELMSLWEKGFIDIDFFQDDPTVSLNIKAGNILEVSKLSPEEQWSLAEIVRSIAEEL